MPLRLLGMLVLVIFEALVPEPPIAVMIGEANANATIPPITQRSGETCRPSKRRTPSGGIFRVARRRTCFSIPNSRPRSHLPRRHLRVPAQPPAFRA